MISFSRKHRRSVIVLIFVVLLTPKLWAQDTIQLSLLPRNTPILEYERFIDLVAFIKETLDQEVELTIANSYADHIKQIKSGSALLGFQNPVVYGEVAADVKPVFIVSKGDFKTKTRGLIIVRVDGGIASIPDLRGKRVSFVSKQSSGGFESQKRFLDKFKINVTDDLTLVPTHEPIEENVIMKVFNKTVDAGFISEESLHLHDGAIDPSQIQVLTTTEWIPNWIFTAHKRMDPSTLATLQSALLNLPEDSPVLKKMQVNALVKPSRDNMRFLISSLAAL